MLFQIQKFFQRNFDPTCITCAVGPVFTLASICGGFSGSYKCEHAKYSIFVSHFKTNQILLFVSVFITFFNILACCFYVHVIILHTNDKIILLVQISKLLHTLSGLTFCFFNICGYKKYVLQLNGWINLCKIYGLCLDLRSIAKVKILLWVYFVFNILTRFGLHLNDYILGSELDGITFIVTKISAVWIGFLEVSMITSFSAIIWVFRLSLKQSQKLLKRRFMKNDQTLLRSIVRWRRLYYAFMSNFRCFLILTTPYFLLWFSSMLAQIIVNIYGCVSMLNQGSYNNDLLVIQIRIGYLCGWILLMLVNLEYLTSTSYNFLSFLFKFHLSTLSDSEANQVEALILTLVTEKPLLRASDVFTVGIGLLAPVSGLIVTYVLVALQFHPSQPTSNW